MRSLWLASVAFAISTGIACAQTPPPAPAPTGAPNAMSPGNMAPPSAPPTNPGMMAPAPQSMAPASSGATSGGMGMTQPMHHNMSSMPANGSVDTYMNIAQTAVRNHNKAQADEALSRAETRLLTRSVPQSSTIPADDSPAVTAIEHARDAIRSGNMQQASTDIDTAMQQMHQGSMNGMGGAMSNPSMSTPSGMSKPMSTPSGMSQ
jgi:hypothetical protein